MVEEVFVKVVVDDNKEETYSHPYYRPNKGNSRRSNSRGPNNRIAGRGNFTPNRSPLTYERSYKSPTELGEVEIYVQDPKDHEEKLKTKIYPIDGLHFDRTVLAFIRIERLAIRTPRVISSRTLHGP